MQALSCIIIFSSFANVLRTQYLIPMKKDKSYAFSIIAGALANLILNSLLIPLFGAMGAVIGTIGAEGIVCLGHIWSVRKQLSLKIYFKEWFQFFICGAFMFILVRGVGTFIDNTNIKLFVEIICGIVSYCILGVLVLIVKKDDLFMHISRKRGCD